MSDQEITDRDETRRLAYIALAASNPQVCDNRMHELVGTLAHALVHHAGNGDVRAIDVIANITAAMFGDGSTGVEARRELQSVIDDLSADIKRFKADPRGALVESTIPDSPRRAFLRAVHAALDAVANNPDARWFEGASSGDTMHGIEVALDGYIGGLGGVTRHDLSQALDLLDEVLGKFTKTGHPGYAALTTGWHSRDQVREWRERAAELRQRPRLIDPGAL